MSSLFGLGLLPGAARAEWTSFFRRIPGTNPMASLLKDSLAESEETPSPGRLEAQSIDGVRIEGAWSKTFAGRLWKGVLTDKERESLRDLRAKAPEIELRLRSRTGALEDWPLELVLVERDGRLEPTWSYAFVPPGADRVIEERTSADGSPGERREVHSSLYERAGSAVPPREASGRPEEVTLGELETGERLRTPRFSVTTGLGQAAEAGPRGFFFDTEDPRFDEVQVFYITQDFLRWAAELGLESVAPLEIKTHASPSSNAAFYYRGRVRLGDGDGERFAHRLRDSSVVLHEVAHALVDRAARLPSEGVAGGLNEAFADYLAASFLNDPLVGRASSVSGLPVRDLSDTGPLSPDPAQLGVYGLGLAVAGAFWELRTALGPEIADRLVARGLLSLGPTSDLIDLRQALETEAEKLLQPQRQDDLRLRLDRRGWPQRRRSAP
jgi:hypothetical protein